MVAISGHGFGHLAQVAPVVNLLLEQRPDIRLTVRTAIEPTIVARRIRVPFFLQYAEDDFGMVQGNAFDVDREESCRRYQQIDSQWQQRVEKISTELEGDRPDLILADIPFLTLAAAERLAIPTVALCSLHWGEIYRHYCGERPEAQGLLGRMMSAYGSCQTFLCPTPAMAMPGLDNLLTIGPIAERFPSRRDQLRTRMGVGDGERVVLVSLGGIDTPLALERWPLIDGVRFVVPGSEAVERPDMVPMEALNISFGELLASSDLLLTKPGYGSFTESVVNGVPLLYVPREDWPEQAVLVDWLEGSGWGSALSREALQSGDIVDPIMARLAARGGIRVEPAGVEQSLSVLSEILASVR